MQNGQRGFQYQVPQPTGLLAQTYKTRQLWATSAKPGGEVWGIHLAAWQRAGGDRATVGLRPAGCRAIVTWGGGANDGGSAVEIATVDYPSSGCVLRVHGANVGVEVQAIVSNNTVTDVSPVLSGWLTEGLDVDMRERAATLTELIATIAVGTGQVYTVPPRARAFRLMSFENGQGAPNPITALQLSGNATPRTVQNDIVWDGTSTPIEAAQASNRQAWFPLSPEVATVVLSNGAAADGTLSAALQWLIELG